ncbi:hypothetical protein MNBD_PLANCTO02-2811 [hydrothermal vent metagenome]|uniref:Methane oxygenase PmoA n=1 Tax=hydrothermal vent metagenome TaxID=652676 RepID=A0A3B1DLB8_9ZZZZ
MKYLFSLLFVFTIAVPLQAEGRVELKVQKNGTVIVNIDGKHFTTYNTSSKLPKPYFWPVKSATGDIITRDLIPLDYVKPKKGEKRKRLDHPHHRGIWVSVDEVNHIKFWKEDGKIINKAVILQQASDNPAKLEVINHWMGKDGKPILIETTVISIYPNRLMAYDITLTAAKKKVTFRDTKEGLLGFRMVDSMNEKLGDGTSINNHNDKNMKGCWGKKADWVDYYGTVNGKTVGVALFDNPKNFRASRYHVRNYGLFTISPFGDKAYTKGKEAAKELVLQPGESVRLRYGLYIHAGNTKQGNVSKVHTMYLKSTK